jgi:hypothetical protein
VGVLARLTISPSAHVPIPTPSKIARTTGPSGPLKFFASFKGSIFNFSGLSHFDVTKGAFAVFIRQDLQDFSDISFWLS